MSFWLNNNRLASEVFILSCFVYSIPSMVPGSKNVCWVNGLVEELEVDKNITINDTETRNEVVLKAETEDNKYYTSTY